MAMLILKRSWAVARCLRDPTQIDPAKLLTAGLVSAALSGFMALGFALDLDDPLGSIMLRAGWLVHPVLIYLAVQLGRGHAWRRGSLSSLAAGMAGLFFWAAGVYFKINGVLIAYPFIVP
jgi:hypothetical protein